MSSIADDIFDLLNKDLSGAQIARKLANIGCGSEAEGIRRIAYCVAHFEGTRKLRLGRLQGGLGGLALAGIFGGGYFLYRRHKKKEQAALEQEREDIIRKLMEPVTEDSPDQSGAPREEGADAAADTQS